MVYHSRLFLSSRTSSLKTDLCFWTTIFDTFERIYVNEHVVFINGAFVKLDWGSSSKLVTQMQDFYLGKCPGVEIFLQRGERGMDFTSHVERASHENEREPGKELTQTIETGISHFKNGLLVTIEKYLSQEFLVSKLTLLCTVTIPKCPSYDQEWNSCIKCGIDTDVRWD